MPNPNQRTTAPENYVQTSVATQIAIPEISRIPTPAAVAYTPSGSFKSPLPGILTDPDQQRNFYNRGINVKRFWPTTNA